MGKDQHSSQLPFDLVPENSVRREDLIESAANTTAISMVDAWPAWPGSTTVLAGPIGSGKSHISAVWRELAHAEKLYCNELTSKVDDIIASAQAGGCVLIEDAGIGPIDETAMFHVLNAIRQGGGYCLITSRQWPSQWRITLPDLASRLKAAQLIELEEPDDQLLKLVMLKLFSDRQLGIDEKVLDYCVVRMERSLQSAAQVVDAIDKEALARKTPITRAIASAALEKLHMI